MKRALLVISTSMFIVVLSCCAKPPTPAQVASANYGPEPHDYRQVITAFMHPALFDPYSAKYEGWKGPSKGYYYDTNGAKYGYRVCVNVNAKNRMGAYVGLSRYYYLINNGKVVAYKGGGDSFAQSMVRRRFCNF